VAPSEQDVLRNRIAGLATAVGAHNQREEAMLRELVSHVDAWGRARVEIMDESHMSEHREIVTALFMASKADAAAAGASATEMLERLESHMAREEEVLLSEAVLSDDEVVSDAFGG
jgi:hypothetical protein